MLLIFHKCCSLFCCFYLPRDSSSMCSAKNKAAVTYSCHTYTLPISQMSCWRWTLLDIHPHFIPICPQFCCFRLLSSHHLFFIIMPFNRGYWQMDGWSAERIHGRANKCGEEMARVHMCSLMCCISLCLTLLSLSIISQNESKRERFRIMLWGKHFALMEAWEVHAWMGIWIDRRMARQTDR